MKEEKKKSFANSKNGGGLKTKKRKKAFTLIELLAIIVILAIIAVITVPIILNIIENSRKGAAIDSAYGYKDAVNKAYVQELSKPNQEGLKLNGTYEVQSDGTLKPATGSTFGIATENYALPVSVSGDKPTSGSLTYDNNVLTSGTLIIGDYTATYSNGSFTAVKTSASSNGTGTSESETPSNPYLTRFDGNYTYFVSLENPRVSSPTGYDFNYEDYQEPSNNNECPSGYAYVEGYDEYVAGCYYVDNYYCDNGDYNYEIGMCQYCEIGSYDGGTGKCENFYDWTEYLNDDWTEYLRSDGIKYEVCGVFGSGQASTVCLTGSYYNSNYSSEEYYYSDFEDCNDIDDLITYDGTGSTCLKGYAKAKADEMLSKGASCYFRYDSVECYMPSGDYCAVSSYDGAECGKCKVSNSGYHYCEL